jgi:hypothetical protein
MIEPASAHTASAPRTEVAPWRVEVSRGVAGQQRFQAAPGARGAALERRRVKPDLAPQLAVGAVAGRPPLDALPTALLLFCQR